jgi:hypothetical protein
MGGLGGPMPLGGAIPGGNPAAQVNHAANFDQLMKEDPFLARQYVDMDPNAAQWYRQNQIGIARDYFGATPDWVNGGNGSQGWAPMNQWINDNSAGGGTWSRRGGNALDVVNPEAYQRLKGMLRGPSGGQLEQPMGNPMMEQRNNFIQGGLLSNRRGLGGLGRVSRGPDLRNTAITNVRPR